MRVIPLIDPTNPIPLKYPIPPKEPPPMPNETGKRYTCSQCGSEFLVTRGGDGALKCCDRPANLKQ